VSARFQLQLERGRYRLGDTVTGSILVLEGGRSRSLEVSLVYKEETEDFSTIATSISSGPLHAGDLTDGMSFEFEVTLPPAGFPSYVSKHGELYWLVDVKSDEFGTDTHELQRIEVEPMPRT
jgi:hypothetical protein